MAILCAGVRGLAIEEASCAEVGVVVCRVPKLDARLSTRQCRWKEVRGHV